MAFVSGFGSIVLAMFWKLVAMCAMSGASGVATVERMAEAGRHGATSLKIRHQDLREKVEYKEAEFIFDATVDGRFNIKFARNA